ncbi:condensation domain-containing protein [Streptomyces sp. NPDC090083]|uniref:condensation domain-containing protein n=1 Tax=Streptomyces sp. NPDC090083 TaxID=3365941 RepID=UPI00381D3708
MPGLTALGAGTPFPLTYEQDRFHTKTRSDGWSHKNVQLGFEILGDLDTDALTDAVRAFVVRHDALHLQMDPVPGPHPQQWTRPIAADEEVVRRVNVKAASPAQFSRYASVLLSRDCVTPWSYGTQRPFSIRLLRHDAHHHALLATFQNLVFDGRAHHLFGHEVWRHYQALRDGEPLPDTAPSFAEAAVRQRAGTGVRQRERALASWRERLTALTRLSWSAPEGTGHSEAGGTVGGELSGGTVAALRDTCAEFRFTVLQTTVSFFVAALAARTGRTEVGLWTSMDSRSSRDADVVGMFAGSCPLVVRDAAADTQSVRTQVRDQLLTALRHQGLTAGDIATLTREAEEENAAPVSRDVYVNLRRFDGNSTVADDAGRLRITDDAYPLHRITFQDGFALHLRCTEFRDRLCVDLLYDGRRADRLLARSILDDVLAGITAVAGGARPGAA